MSEDTTKLRPAPPDAVLDELKWRGLVHQCTDASEGMEEIRKHLRSADMAAGGRRVYCGFDPTADSLTIGNLVPIMLLRHFQRFGHTPVVVMGGGTGLIGDPSGKSAERELMTEERVGGNVEKQRVIFERILDVAPAMVNRATIENNLDWLGKLGFLEALRKIGKRFSVNQMIQKDSVRERLNNRDQGISFTEFSYQILQAYDYLVLFERGVTLQVGGSDQWGNIVAGEDLIRRVIGSVVAKTVALGVLNSGRASPEYEAARAELREIVLDVDSRIPELVERVRPKYERAMAAQQPPSAQELLTWCEAEARAANLSQAFGVTAPLVTKADGGKFGKTETGAVWLTRERTSPYAYYQFWLNADDRDVERFLKIFTLLDQETIRGLMEKHQQEPGAREAHRALAREATELLHGAQEMERAESAAKALFSGDVKGLDEATLSEAFASAPTSEHARAELAEGKSLVDLLVETGLAKSKREAREFLQNGSISVNGEKVGPEDRLTPGMLLHGSVALLRRGKKQWHVTRWK